MKPEYLTGRKYKVYRYRGLPLRTAFGGATKRYKSIQTKLHVDGVPYGDVTALVDEMLKKKPGNAYSTLVEWQRYIWRGIDLQEILPARKFDTLVAFMRKHPGFSLDDYVVKAALQGFLMVRTKYWYKGKPLIRQLPYLEYMSVKNYMRYRGWSVTRSVETLAAARGWTYDDLRREFDTHGHRASRLPRDVPPLVHRIENACDERPIVPATQKR